MAKRRNEPSLEELQARNLVTLLGEDVRQACGSPLPPEVQARWGANLTAILREHARTAVADAHENAVGAPPTLDQALRDVITTARSRDGVTGQAVHTALAVADRSEQQIAALRRIVAELRDDGITDAALVAAEATVTVPLELWSTLALGAATTLDELREGAIFMTDDGVFAVKSEYTYGNAPGSQWQCVLLASGEYAHFPQKNRTRVREVLIQGLSNEVDE